MKKTIFLVAFAAAATVSAETTSVVEYDGNGGYLIKKLTVESKTDNKKITSEYDKKNLINKKKSKTVDSTKYLKQSKPSVKNLTQPKTKNKGLEDIQKERALEEQRLIEFIDNRNRAIAERQRAEALRLRPPTPVNPP